jgi:transposase InsO family protein
MKQIARNLTDAVDGFLRDARYIILDRDPLYTAAFRRMLQDSGVKVVRLPARSPNLNAHAERFVLTIKSDCLNRMTPLGERHPRSAITEFMLHDHGERHHQGLGHRLLELDETAEESAGSVAYRERVGGMFRYYYREAA